MKIRHLVAGPLCAILAAGPAWAEDEPSEPVSRDLAADVSAPKEAWWTGPIAASSADTLPHGHILIEPYLYDVRSPGGDYLGSLTYLLYGLTDRTTVGVIPTFGSARSRGSTSARRLAVSDLTLQAQFRLHRAAVGDLVPTLAVLIQRGVPLGRYDRLDNDPDRGIGGGVAPIVFGLNAQRVDRLPSGRAIRTRINVARSLPSKTQVQGASVFGTPSGFLGSAKVGPTTNVDVSIEYSVTRRLALATDLIARWTAAGSVAGEVIAADARGSFASTSAKGRSFSVAPAVEYSWTSSRGVLLGARWTAAGRGRPGSVTPVLALNVVL